MTELELIVDHQAMKGLLFTHHTRATFDFDRNETVKGFWVNLFDPHRFAIRQRLGSSPGGLGGGSFAPFPHFSPIFPLSRKSLKFRPFRHILP